jgi:putative tricarboxylic transport membrane protein
VNAFGLLHGLESASRRPTSCGSSSAPPGHLVGILPGLGPPATISILLPLAAGFNPARPDRDGGIYYGAKYGGSTTSILLNIPGESSSVVTCIDGYEMAKKGRAGQALGIAAIGSFVAGTLGVIGLTFLAPVAADVAVNFGPPEYSALMVFALLLVIMLAGDSMLKGFISMFIGLFLATIGTDLFSGEQRFTGGQIELAGGIEFIALSVGIFAIGEVLVNIEDKTEKKLFEVPKKLRELLPSKADIKTSTPAMLQGGVVGFIIGILPGAGSTGVAFVSYIIAKKTSKTPRVRPCARSRVNGCAQAANNSETGGAMVPLLTMGIPDPARRSTSRRARAVRAQPGAAAFPRTAPTWCGPSSPACTWAISPCW